jgi:RNA-binding protein
MPAIELSIADRRDKRASAHHLAPVVHVGAGGLSDAVLREVDAALTAHELIKVKVHDDDRQVREGLLATLAERLGAAPVQHIGKLLVLWRPAPAKAGSAPAAARTGAAPKVVRIVKFSKTGNHRPTVKKVTVLGNQRVTAGGEIKRAKSRPTSRKKQSLG